MLTETDTMTKPTHHLTKREQQVLKLMASGLTNPQIAEKMKLSSNTTVKYRRNLFRTFKVHTSVMLLRAALEAGELSMTDLQ